MIPSLTLKGKTALITGASGGLGRQFTRILSAASARVILVARRFEQIESLASSLGNAKTIQIDVSNKRSVEKCFADLEKAGEKIDICVNTAGIGKLTPIFKEDTNDDFESIIQTNLMGTWYVTKAVTNHMKNNHIPGSIINIASINGGGVPALEGSAYSVSKAGVIHLTKSLVGELAPHTIRINCISPGWVETNMTKAYKDKITSLIPAGEIAKPSDLDGLILYLASNDASKYVTGSCFTIDGGASWGGR